MIGVTVGSPDWKCEDIRVDNPDGNFFINESNSEGLKGGTLPWLKDTIMDDGLLWGTVGSLELKCEGIRVDNPDGNSKMFPVGTSDGATLGLINNKMLGISDSSKLARELGFGIS